MILQPKTLFLIDGLGALLSAFLLGVVLTSFEEFFGMPRIVLYSLSFLAVLFAVYSSLCYLKTPENWPTYLKTIAILNLLYCFVTIGLVFHFFEQLTMFGIIYFVCEIFVILTLASIELKLAMHHSRDSV